jgi:signal transduction histidine kinase
MSTDSGKIKIEALRGILKRLNSNSLPLEARLALGKALGYVDELAEILNSGEEQSRLEALYHVSRVLGTSLNLDEVLTQVMDAVIGLTGAERGLLVLADSGTSTWQIRAARNFAKKDLQPDEMSFSRTVINTVLQTGQGVVTTDAQQDPRFAQHESIVTMALRSILCAPLLVRDRVSGVIYVENRIQRNLFNQADLELLNTFAAQAAIAIENARLYTRTDRALAQRVAELENLAQIDRQLTERLDFTHVLDFTHRWALRGTGAEKGWIMFLDGSSQVGEMVVYPSETPGISPDDPLIVRTLATGMPQFADMGSQPGGRLAVPLLHSGGTLGVIVVQHPGTFLKGAAQFLERLAGRAAPAIENARLFQDVQEANQSKTKFVSVVTHELRIPMTSIKGYTDLLRQQAVGPINEQQLNFLNVVRSNVERMSALVADLSDISRIESGQLKLECNSISLEKYIDEALRNLRPKIGEKGQSLEVDLPLDLPMVRADANRLVQVLNNLVSNAWKYSPAGGKIHLTASREGEFVRLAISDNGIGISEEDQSQLFSQFYRSEDPFVREEQGWGLGLNVSRHLVELMGGTIGVRSAYQAGSTFWFTLPVAKQGT